MQNILTRLELLEKQSATLEPNADQRASYHKEILAYAHQFIDTIHDRHAYKKEDRPLVGLDIDGEKYSLPHLLALYKSEVNEFGINPAGGGHIGYIPGGGIYAAALADYIADISNEYAGIHFGSPGAVRIENELIDWMKEVFGFPSTAVGNLSSGGSIANLIALTAARDKHKIKGTTIEKSVIYMSEQVHHCIHKALRIIGLEDIVVRHIPLDQHSRMKTHDLSLMIAQDKTKGLLPFLVIASAGTTDTGAIDPLDAIADIAEANHLWFHVDGAYGGFFILVEKLKAAFKGIERADSLVIDPHKSLFLPYGTGAVLVKDIKAVMHSHYYLANYMQDTYDSTQAINPADVSPELTKHFRGLRLWLPLKMYGLTPFIACLEEKILLTQYFRMRLAALGFELGPAPDLSVSYFWYPHPKDSNTFNEKLMKAIHKDGRIFLSSTTINDRFVIRMAILSFRTKRKTIDKAIEMIEDALETILASKPLPLD